MIGVLSAIKDAAVGSGPFNPKKLVLEIETKGGRAFPHMLNPTDYKVGRKVSWKCQPTQTPQGSAGSPYFVFGGGGDTFSFSAVLDCSEEMDEDLIKEVEALYDLTYPFTKDDGQLRAQLVRVWWGSFKFVGVVDSVDITVNLFDPQGRMKRATVSIAMQGHAFSTLAASAGEDFFRKPRVDKGTTEAPGTGKYESLTATSGSAPSAATGLLGALSKLGI